MPNPNQSYRKTSDEIKKQRAEVPYFKGLSDNNVSKKILSKKKTMDKKSYAKWWASQNEYKIKLNAQKYYLNNKEKILEYQKKYRAENPDIFKAQAVKRFNRKHEKYWEERMEKPINERAKHLIYTGSGNKFITKLRKKNLEYLYRKAPELKGTKMDDDQLMKYILRNEDI